MDIAKLANSGDRIKRDVLDLDTQLQLVAMNKRHINRNLALNDSVHPDVQPTLYAQGDSDTQHNLLTNKNLSSEVQITVWEHHPRFRRTLANRQGRSSEIISFALEGDADLRIALAASEGLPIAIVDQLVNDPAEVVRMNAAKAQDLTAEQFDKLMEDTPLVVLLLAQRGNRLTQEQKLRLATHPSEKIQKALSDSCTFHPERDTWLPVSFVRKYRFDYLRFMSWRHRDDFATIEIVSREWDGSVQSLLNAYEHSQL